MPKVKVNLKNWLMILTIILVVLGLMYLISASMVVGRQDHNNPFYFLKEQVLKGIIPGIAIFLILSRFNVRWLKKLSGVALFVNVLLLLALRIPNIGKTVNGATRWINILGFQFQPSEFLKITLVLFWAGFLSNKSREQLADWRKTILPFVIINGIILFLLFIQPATSIVAILALTVIVMIISTNIPMKGILVAGAIFLLLFVGVIKLSSITGKTNYRLDRITSFLNRKTDTHYQLKQSKVGISRGGLFGVGFGQSRQKYNYLPESYTDSIFSVIAEEFGFVFGTIIVMGLYFMLFFYGSYLSTHTGDSFMALVSIGTVTWISIQALIHIACMSGLIPLTGLPLPFISYGGSAFVTVMAGMGLLNNAVRNAE